MLTKGELEAMSDAQLKALGDDLAKRWHDNLRAEIAAGGTVGKSLRGGTRRRLTRVAKPNRQRQEQLREEGRALSRDSEMVRVEVRRRAHAEEARA